MEERQDRLGPRVPRCGAPGAADAGDAERSERATAATTAMGVADWLSLAAAPTFAIMAMLTGVVGPAKMPLICTASQELSWLGGMVPMYLLMSGFHLAPWLRLVAKWRRGAGVALRGQE